ncbi:hypothetical protein F5Y10DRAFT_200230 [Nemania abortiva]|nr:hypothetical protein F5Y10DRAFT_200230 [Nemania abortiva]
MADNIADSRSDISAASDTPYEVRSAGTGRGVGCFATRDIRAGETVLVTYTALTWLDGEDVYERTNHYLELYGRLGEADRRAWAELAAHESKLKPKYHEELSRRKYRGKTPTVEQRDYYVHLFLAAETNCFDLVGTDEPQSVLFTEAARFNHSCDPNVDYVCDVKKLRWVGRAKRDIRQGEELLVTYSYCHDHTEQRLSNTRVWGFECDCPRCHDGPDTYTDSLIRARDLVNGVEPQPAAPSLYADDNRSVEERYRTRLELLREIVAKEGDAAEKKIRQRELVFLLLDAAEYYRSWARQWLDEAMEREERQRYRGVARELYRESLQVAKTAWSERHESK